MRNNPAHGPTEFREYPVHQPKKKKAKPEMLTIAAGGLVFAHNKILLDRADSADMWSVPGGAVGFSQSPTELVIHRLKQELNIDAEIIDTPPFLFKFEVETEAQIETILLLHFVVKVVKPAEILMGGDIIDYRWESIGSNFRDCYPNVKPAVDHFMKL